MNEWISWTAKDVLRPTCTSVVRVILETSTWPQEPDIFQSRKPIALRGTKPIFDAFDFAPFSGFVVK